MNEPTNLWKEFNSEEHFTPELEKSRFDSLHSWDLAWELLEPIDKAKDDEHEIELTKTMSPGQKMVYFYWYLDGQVTNGGFVQFYLNGYDNYLPAILDALQLLGDKEALDLVNKVHLYVQQNSSQFIEYAEKDDIEGLYEALPELEPLEEQYFEMREETIIQIEKYIRANQGEFVTLK
jgi:hypothetical protein